MNLPKKPNHKKQNGEHRISTNTQTTRNKMANNEFPQIHKPQEKNSQSPNFHKYTNHKKKIRKHRIFTNTHTTPIFQIREP
jgi:hypothetical protein